MSEEMVRRGGIYKYRTINLKCKEGSLILFQYDGELIASASFLENVKYNEPNAVNKGYFLFDVDSIRIFKEPITSEEFFYIDSSYKIFNNQRHYVNYTISENVIVHKTIVSVKKINVYKIKIKYLTGGVFYE